MIFFVGDEEEMRVSKNAKKERGGELANMTSGVLESIVEDKDGVSDNVGGRGGDAASFGCGSIGLHN